MPDYTFGLSRSLYSDLARFVDDPISTLADEEREAEGRAKLDKIASQPRETTHSPLSASVSSTETDKPLHPLMSSTSTSSFGPATVQPILQFATPSESAPSNTSPHVVVESEGETFQQTIFPNLFDTFIPPETHVKAPLLEPDTRPLFSLGNTLDSLVQHYIDFAFRFPRVCIQHSKCRRGSLATCLRIEWQHLCYCIYYCSFETKEKDKGVIKTIVHQ